MPEGTRTLSLSPRRVHSAGLTYRGHLRELGERPDPAGPAIFPRRADSLAGPEDSLPRPSVEQMIAVVNGVEPGLGDTVRRRHPQLSPLFDYEVELGVVLLEDIGEDELSGGKSRLPLGFFLANDLTARSVQILGEGAVDRMAFWSASKSFPSTLLTGPLLSRPPGCEFA